MINILFFAKYREQFGASGLELPAAGLADIATLMERLQKDFPARTAFLQDQKLFISLNQELVGPAQTLRDGDAVAFFPPVTGG